MREPGSAAGSAGAIDWSSTDLGDPTLWPGNLRLCVEIVLNTPLPMLLLWGERRALVFNAAYAELAGIRPDRVPGGHTPALWPLPLSVCPEAVTRALAGEVLQLPAQRLRFPHDGGDGLDFDLFLTPVRAEPGQTGGVLCALARTAARLPEASLAPVALRILVVEDNFDSQYLVCEMLRAFGHEADGVGHAEGALSMLAKASYNVLFSDVSLPGMSGVELARQALRLQPALKVIFASGYGDALLRHVEFPHQSLQKPYELERLQAALAQVDQELRSAA